MTLSAFVPTPFVPAWWLPGPHLQTLGARALRRTGGVSFGRYRLELPDGDFVDLDFPYGLTETAESRHPLVLVLHGLEGSARSTYAIQTYRRLQEAGMRGVGLNFRSCSGELNRLPRLYHSGETGDVGLVVEWLRKRFPGRVLGAIGFSLGGNVLLKYLGELGASATDVVTAAVAISVPFDLSAGASHLERLGGQLYTRYLLQKLQRKVAAKKNIIEDRIDFTRALAATTFRDFDDAATARLHGFEGAEDYYRRSSSSRFLDRISVPTLLIHSDDDPFLPATSVPRSNVTSNLHIEAAFTRGGGHVGFVRGNPWHPDFWAEAEATRFLTHEFGSK